MVHFWHPASGSRHAVLSYDGCEVELGGMAKEIHLDRVFLKHGTTGRFKRVRTSSAYSLDELRQNYAGGGSVAQPFEVKGTPRAGDGNGNQGNCHVCKGPDSIHGPMYWPGRGVAPGSSRSAGTAITRTMVMS